VNGGSQNDTTEWRFCQWFYTLAGKEKNLTLRFSGGPMATSPTDDCTSAPLHRQKLPKFYTDFTGKTSPNQTPPQQKPSSGRPLQTVC
jgi:hypothetical protein